MKHNIFFLKIKNSWRRSEISYFYFKSIWLFMPQKFIPLPKCVFMLIYLAVPVRLLCSRYGMCLLVSRSMYSLASPKSAKKENQRHNSNIYQKAQQWHLTAFVLRCHLNLSADVTSASRKDRHQLEKLKKHLEWRGKKWRCSPIMCITLSFLVELRPMRKFSGLTSR